MVNIKINDVPISVEEGTTILEACREAKMIVPTLCYLKDINEIGACRVCVVEIKGIERLVTSCNNTVKEGMEIYTNSPKVRDARRINIKLILSQHNCFCPKVETASFRKLPTTLNSEVVLSNNTLQKRSGLWTSLLSVTRANVSNVCAVSRFVIKYSL